MATGRILQFDHARGYGFVAADDGGEDVFLHASVFDGEMDELAPGMPVEFKVMAGDRGRKAFAAHLIPDDAPDETAVRMRQVAAAVMPTVTSMPAPISASVSDPADTDKPDEEQMCDVLSGTEFAQKMSELLLTSVPVLTGHQIVDVRQTMLEFARKHGWVDIL